MELDKQDLKLLSMLQVDVKTSIELLSEKIGLSTASVQRRLKRLRKENVITSEVANISPEAVGQAMTFIISVQLNRDNMDCFNTFKRKVKKTAQVQQCYYITGEADFILIVTAKDMIDFEAFTQSIFFTDNNVKHFKTSVVMGRTKVSLALPLG
ncbi:Lrp/AsnC family transcriptional regulator [Paraglaciecola arctica]|uniref:Lrp/AsnC family transcriptional regulator, leucine-responsive regulatory protein n=1 Tax=Paraglaciecola arctica BSs20135 TaxID=493475 RepID=K6Z346_9ALTE|nr:Lrp/AsnC family transcriptional regulator [Paraglaciecola arctica]GAC17845.1 Lrp/AsnC family transcriptional regulator, leucine-responsive regulatory protein [Paraglaciecola arctica BSs20135]